MHDSHKNRETTLRNGHSEYKASPELMARSIEQAKILTCPREHVLFRTGETSTGRFLQIGRVESVVLL